MHILLKHANSLKPDKYVKSETSLGTSHYFTYGNMVIRISNHIGTNSTGMFHIIFDIANRKNYILHNPKKNVLTNMNIVEIKAFIKAISLSAQLNSLALINDMNFIKNLDDEIAHLKTTKLKLDTTISNLKNEQVRYVLGNTAKSNIIKKWFKKRKFQTKDFTFDNPSIAYVFNYKSYQISTSTDLQLLKRFAHQEII